MAAYAGLVQWVVFLNGWLGRPAGPVKPGRYLAGFDGSAAKETSTSEGAGMFRVTAPSTELPPTTLAEFKLTEESAGFSAALIPATTSNKNKHETTVLKLRIRLLYEASWTTMCTTAVESTGRPSCNAGLNLICSAALTACSSNP